MSLLQLAVMSGCVVFALITVMAAAWRIQEASGNSGWVDVSWTFGVGGVAFLAALARLAQEAAEEAAQGAAPEPWPHWRQIVVAGLVAVWSLRLGLHIVARTRAAGDDPRYRQLVVEWQSNASRRMFWFLQAQAMVGVVLVISVVLAAQNGNPDLRIQDVLGIAILAAAISGEAIADRQLRRFKADPSKQGAVCGIGLWRWSRHPNYFFEWLGWLAYPLIAIDSSGHNPYGWLALLAPACMYWVLVHVSGVPPLEDHMLRSRGDVFRAYQRRTRAFLPFPLIRQPGHRV
jgi:steroid 5-alpha reductase family enzyme